MSRNFTDLEIEKLDVKMTFLHGDLEEEIYMKQPEGFKVPGKENIVCHLTKSLYGLKQAPRQWYKKFDAFMAEHDFKRTESDHCVFIKRYASGDFLILLLYVDDMLIERQRHFGIIRKNKSRKSRGSNWQTLSIANENLVRAFKRFYLLDILRFSSNMERST